MDKAARIRESNDAFRRTFVGGTVLLTQGVDQLDGAEKSAVLRSIQEFDSFSSANDPYREHDFVSVERDSVTYFAKIEYCAPDTESGSEDPSDPVQTVRVLTIMRADEY